MENPYLIVAPSDHAKAEAVLHRLNRDVLGDRIPMDSFSSPVLPPGELYLVEI